MTGAGWMILTWGFLVGCRDCSRRRKCAAWALAPLTQRAGGGTAMPLQAARTQALCLGDPGDTCTAPGTPGARTTHPHSAVAAGSRGRFLLLHDRMTKGSRRTGQGGGGDGPPSTVYKGRPTVSVRLDLHSWGWACYQRTPAGGGLSLG